MYKKCCVSQDAVYNTKDHKKQPSMSTGENDVGMEESNASRGANYDEIEESNGN